MKRKKILVRGPGLTRSGYGEQTRFALRALKTHEEFFDIYFEPLNWGQTGWLSDDDEERKWMDSLVAKTISYSQRNPQYDVAVQVTIPQEWENIGKVNIGYTAGTETTKISGEWIGKCNEVDKIITVSDHTKAAFENSVYDVIDNTTGEKRSGYRCATPLETIGFATRTVKPEPLDLELPNDFNFLMVSQWSVRKNIENTVRWFIEEFKDDDVGLVLKLNTKNNSIKDSEFTRKRLKSLIDDTKGKRKCKIHLLHGDLTDGQMTSLYRDSKIKCLINLAHGEGFGLPMFEAVQNELPVLAPNWSGHTDYLYAPQKDKKTKKVKKRPHFASVEYTIQPIQKEAVWHPVLIEDSMWAYPQKVSYAKALRDVFKNNGKYNKLAKALKKHVDKNFSPEKLYGRFAEICYGAKLQLEPADYVFVSDFFTDEYAGGAELSFESLINSCSGTKVKVKSDNVSEKHLEYYKDSKWVFGNYTGLQVGFMEELLKSKDSLNINIVEFDYKFCKYRNLELHKAMEGKDCTCADEPHGKRISAFLTAASNVFFMSQKQMDIHLSSITDLEKDKCSVLSSVFDENVLDKIKELREENKDKKEDFWAIPTSTLWVKGSEEAKKWCTKNEHNTVELTNMSYINLLETLAKAKGLCFLPAGADTCPRLVIEAKLLGCELNLNENVQHTTESWFDTDNLEDIEGYLKSVRNNFWNKVGTNEQQNTNAVGG